MSNMNTSKLQGFAAEARRSLMAAVSAQVDAALVPNSVIQVDYPQTFDFLKTEICLPLVQPHCRLPLHGRAWLHCYAGGIRSGYEERQWIAGGVGGGETR